MPPDRSRVLQQAQLLASRGQYEAAIAEWKKLAVETPSDGSIYNSIGDLQLKRNAASDAASAFLQAASAFRAEGAVLKAIAAFKKVLKCDPARYEVYRHLGDLNAERGLVSSAVQDYQTLGKYYLKERRGKEALEIYKKIVSYDPSNLSAQQRVAELCVQENLQDEATNVYLQLGRERSAQGRYEEAKDAYLAVLRIDPKNNEAAQFVESIAKSGTGAVKALKSSPVTAAPKSSEPLDLLAEATRRIEEKQYAGAEAILNQMLTREPGNPQVCQLLARLHLYRGDVQVALGEYRFLAGAALRAREMTLAESLIQEFLSVQPNSVPILELNGELYEEKGDPATASQQYGKAVELLLEHPEPGMESLHEELFEKVRALSTDDELVNRLAIKMKGTSVAEGSSSTKGTATEAASSSHVSSQANGVASTELTVGEANSSGAGMLGQEFSLVGAEPDAVGASFIDDRQVRNIDTPSVAVSPEEHVQEPSEGCMQAPEPTANGAMDAAVLPHVGGNTSSAAAPDLTVDKPVTASVSKTPLTEVNEPPSKVAFPKTVAASPIVEQAASSPRSIPQVPTTSPPDYEAHYTLGVAYKNMGLYEEAKAEFSVSMHHDVFYLDSALMTALCLKEQHQLAHAIRGIETVLADPRCQGSKAQAIRYELGLLYEAEQQWEHATRAYQTIPSFHDVPQRLAALKGRQQGHDAGFRYAS